MGLDIYSGLYVTRIWNSGFRALGLGFRGSCRALAGGLISCNSLQGFVWLRKGPYRPTTSVPLAESSRTNPCAKNIP